ncbi:MAG: zinc ribbon domain-containing protein [Victivallaceae bacterium]
MITDCPHCKNKIEISDEFVEKVVACPECGDLFKAPRPDYLPKCCPNCGAALEGTDKICLICGYNFKTRQIMITHVPTEYELRPWWFKLLGFIADCLPGLFRPLTLFAFIICVAMFIAVELLAVSIMMMGAFISAFFIAVAGMLIYIHGAAFLATGSIIDLRNAMVELHGRSMEAFVWLASIPTIVILAGMFLASKYLNHT